MIDNESRRPTDPDSPEVTGKLLHEELQAALSHSLTVEDIDSYADNALNGLIAVADRAVQHYSQAAPNDTDKSQLRLETEAFEYYGLGNIPRILDHVAQKAEEICHIDGVIRQALQLQSVITPPDGFIRHGLGSGGGEFVEKETLQRLKTILFVLENDFGVDIDDSDQLTLQRGEVLPTMLRTTPYIEVTVPPLERTILVCDEAENATFVFDTEYVKRIGIHPKMLIEMTKDEMGTLIEQHEGIGQRVIFSKRFVPRIIRSIEHPTSDPEAITHGEEAVGQYLYPKAPEGILSGRSLGKMLGVSQRGMEAAIETLEDELEGRELMRFGSMTTWGYTPDQQAIIRARLAERGLFSETPPEGILSLGGLARALKVSHKPVAEAVERLKDQLGSTETYRFGVRPTQGYTVEQQRIIRADLEQQGLFADRPPEDILSQKGIRAVLNSSGAVISKAIAALGDTLGEVGQYKFGTVVTQGYTPEQVQIIENYMLENDMFKRPAPDGHLSLTGIALEYNVSQNAINTTLGRLGDTLGEVRLYTYGARKVPGFTPEQQELIRQDLEAHGLFNNQTAEDFQSRKAISKSLGESNELIVEAINNLGEDLGAPEIRRVGNVPTTVYSPEQRQKITAYIDTKRGGAQPAPEGYETVFGMSKRFETTRERVSRAISNLQDKGLFGDVGTYQNRGGVSRGYTPEQQAQIREELIHLNTSLQHE